MTLSGRSLSRTPVAGSTEGSWEEGEGLVRVGCERKVWEREGWRCGKAVREGGKGRGKEKKEEERKELGGKEKRRVKKEKGKTHHTPRASQPTLDHLLPNLDLLPPIFNPRFLQSLNEDICSEPGDFEAALGGDSGGGPAGGVEVFRGGDGGDAGRQFAVGEGKQVRRGRKGRKKRTHARDVDEAMRRL
jgi:hypothetical protein